MAVMPVPVKDFADEGETVFWGLLSLVLTVVILLGFARVWLDAGKPDDNDDRH